MVSPNWIECIFEWRVLNPSQIHNCKMLMEIAYISYLHIFYIIFHKTLLYVPVCVLDFGGLWHHFYPYDFNKLNLICQNINIFLNQSPQNKYHWKSEEKNWQNVTSYKLTNLPQKWYVFYKPYLLKQHKHTF